MSDLSLKPIPFEIIGKPNRRASEIERDRAAIELAAYIIGLLKFDPAIHPEYREELLKRANKVRRSQGNGDVVFVAETVEAAVEPSLSPSAFDATEARLALLLQEEA